MIVIVMGVCGCGKTTVGEALAEKLQCEFADADDFHPEANKVKMGQAIPLTDEDRIPWLISIHHYIMRLFTEGNNGIVTCSALKKMYRGILASGEVTPNKDYAEKLPVLFVYLKGDRDLLNQRMEGRSGHFMPVSLLDSQLATLEEPDASEKAVTVSIDNSVDDIVAMVVKECEKTLGRSMNSEDS
ncbi:probable gluconokinase [Haliotis rufescens]|uniref:probable gluconokinase n=1 Tax=Haliotis rufescens TaxID=6454 RepID=UPI001EAF8F2F|nr:probable gluconokinase [Haliotis rufescens]